MASQIHCTDPVALNEWYAIGAVAELPAGLAKKATLLETNLTARRLESGEVAVWIEHGDRLPVRLDFGYVWTTLGQPARDIFAIPEYVEPDRRNMNGASVGVHVSGPRAIENFLDLGHLPIVHENYLGVEPYTEIPPYNVEVSAERNEILATGCRVYQPQASLVATEGSDIDYVYRVPHPYCAVLYKSSAIDAARMDVIALLVQPVDQEHIVAHLMVSLLDDVSSDKAIRGFQQLIFSQDKPILENHIPKRLPLSPRAEMPARVDAMAVAYRRWLRDQHFFYGTLP